MAISVKAELVGPGGNFLATSKRQPVASFQSGAGNDGASGTNGDLFKAWVKQCRAVAAGAVTAGVAAAAEGLKTDLRRRLIEGGLGERFPNAIRHVVYPGKRPSLKAAAWVFAKGKRSVQILEAYSTGATVRARSGKYLAIPTAAAGKPGGRFARLTPKSWEYLRGVKLRLVVPRRRKDILLLVADLRLSKGKRGGFRVPSMAARQRRDYESVVVFILVKQVQVAKRITTEGLGQAWADRIPSLIERALPEL